MISTILHSIASQDFARIPLLFQQLKHSNLSGELKELIAEEDLWNHFSKLDPNHLTRLDHIFLNSFNNMLISLL